MGHALAYLGPKDKKIAAKLVELWWNVRGDHGRSNGWLFCDALWLILLILG